MKKTTKILIFIVVLGIALLIKSNKVEAAQYIWPIGGNNANHTYIDYEFYGQNYTEPYKDGKSGREYIVDNEKWPNEQYYYASCESHFGTDITGINGETYKVVSVVNGTVIATSGNAVFNPSTNYIDRNQRRTQAGLNDGGGYGNYIIIQENGTGRCFLYAHLKGGSFKVSKGSTVIPGQEIATMGSSGDSGHMHLHFEIRKSKAVTLIETIYGNHYLIRTNSYSNLDPKDYIGSQPNVHTPVTDSKKVQISKEDAKLYVKYLYRTVLGREANDNEAEGWANTYISTGSIYNVTQGIFLSAEANNRMGDISNLDFAKKTYEIILYRGNNYTETEMAGHVDRLNRRIWTKRDYLTMLCNSEEFVNNKLSTIIETERKLQAASDEKRNELGIASKEKIKLGDLDGDEMISAVDASLCLILCERAKEVDLKSDKYGYAFEYADVDKDGEITEKDAKLILGYSANLAAEKFTVNEISFEEYVRGIHP